MANPVAVVPRTIVSLGFGVARVPVDLLARVTGHGEDREWGPNLAFDSVEATVRGVLGSVLRDPELAAQGRVKEARVEQHSEAAERDQAAQARREVADDRFQERREQDQQKREQVREQKQEQKQGSRRSASSARRRPRSASSSARSRPSATRRRPTRRSTSTSRRRAGRASRPSPRPWRPSARPPSARPRRWSSPRPPTRPVAVAERRASGLVERLPVPRHGQALTSALRTPAARGSRPVPPGGSRGR